MLRKCVSTLCLAVIPLVLPIGIGQAGRETPRNWVTAVERKQEGQPGLRRRIRAVPMRQKENASGIRTRRAG
jgi:hypothetical protein